MNFSEHLKKCRKNQNLTLNKAAKMIGISTSYLSSLESGSRPAPSFNILRKTADVLELSSEKRHKLYDLAAETKQPPALADDLNEYIYQTPNIRGLLRYAMECGMAENDWNTVGAFVKKNYFY